MMHVWRAIVLACGGACSFIACREPSEPALIDAVDLTSDLYHRTHAGIFLPDREPVVLEALEVSPAPGGRAYFRLRGDVGDIWVKASDDRTLVVHMDARAFFAHWEVACDTPSARVFEEWPVHPVQ
jgi:hypothetical protein